MAGFACFAVSCDPRHTWACSPHPHASAPLKAPCVPKPLPAPSFGFLSSARSVPQQSGRGRRERGEKKPKIHLRNAGKCNGSLQRERERAGRRGQSTCSCLELGLLAGPARGFYEDFASVGFEMAQRGFGLGVPMVLGAAREPWWGQAELGVHRVPGGCAVPVSTEIEMKKNFLSHCPSYESKRERNRERERKISPRDQQ